jgi:hypothetical protein
VSTARRVFRLRGRFQGEFRGQFLDVESGTKGFSAPGKIPGRFPGKRVCFGDIFPGFFLDGNISGTIPGKMPRFQSATVVKDPFAQLQLKQVARGLASRLRAATNSYIEFEIQKNKLPNEAAETNYRIKRLGTRK